MAQTGLPQIIKKIDGVFIGSFNVIGFICALAIIAGKVNMLFFRKFTEATKLTKMI